MIHVPKLSKRSVLFHDNIPGFLQVEYIKILHLEPCLLQVQVGSGDFRGVG